MDNVRTILFEKITITNTEPYPSQSNNERPYIKGLQTRLREFMQPHFIENYIQSILNCLQDKTSLVIGGSGDTISKIMAIKAIKIMAANQVKHIYVPQNNLFTRPAISHFIRKHSLNGGIFIHPCVDEPTGKLQLGIQFIGPDGGPAHEQLVDRIFTCARTITEFSQIEGDEEISLDEIEPLMLKIGKQNIKLDIIDPAKDYLEFLEASFDFPKIRELLTGAVYPRPFKISIDCLGGSAGYFAKNIFEKALRASPGSVENAKQTGDYHYQFFRDEIEHSLYWRQKAIQNEKDLTAVIDTDGTHAAVFGRKGFFVPHGDTFAIITCHAHCIPYFQRKLFKGVGRTVMLSDAVDLVAKQLDIKLYVISENYKYFYDLLDDKLIALWGDNNFSLGTSHSRESDGILIVMAWLSVICHLKRPVQQIVLNHWQTFGRNFNCLYEYHDISAETAYTTLKEINPLGENIIEHAEIGRFTIWIKWPQIFLYQDPVTKMFYTDEKIREVHTTKGRIVYKLIVYPQTALVKLKLEAWNKEVSYTADKVSMTNLLYYIAEQIFSMSLLNVKHKPDVMF